MSIIVLSATNEPTSIDLNYSEILGMVDHMLIEFLVRIASHEARETEI
jgi:hypothetical protein